MDEIYNLEDTKKLETKSDPIEYRKFYDQSSGFTARTPPTVADIQSHFNFRVSDINSYWLLHRAYLLLNFKLAKGTGANERATIANGIGNFFDRCILRFGDTVIEDKPRHFYREFEVDALTWNKQYTDTVGSMMLYHSPNEHSLIAIDKSRASYLKPGSAFQTINGTAGTYADTDALAAALATFNSTHTLQPDVFDDLDTPESKNRVFTDGDSVYCMVPLVHLFNFPKVYEKVIRGLDIELEFYLSNDSTRLIRSSVQSDGAAADTAVAKNYALNWLGAGMTLYLPRVIPTPRVQADLNRMLTKGVSLPIEFEKSIVYRESIPPARQEGEWSITTNTSTPTRLYFMVRSQASESSQLIDLKTSDVLLSQLDVFVNGEKVPTEVVQAEGAAGSGVIQRNYTQYLRLWHDLQGNRDGVYNGLVGGSNINQTLFDLHRIVAIDLKQSSRDLPDRSSDIRVSYKFDIPVPVGKDQWLYCIAYSKATTVLEMSEGRSVALIK